MAQDSQSLGGGRRFCSSCGQRVREDDRFCPSCGSEVGAATTAGADLWAPTAPPVGEPLGFWVRVLAWLIDSVLLAVLCWILLVLTILLWDLVGNSELDILVKVFSTLVIVIPILYHVLFIGLKGQTLGKMALGVRIVNVSGEVPGFWRAVLRELIGKFVSAVIILLGYLWTGWDSHKRGWHDHIGGTYAVRAPSR